MADKKRLLIVDGYNLLGAWSKQAQDFNLEDAREALVHKLHDYAGYSGEEIIVVFDAWQSDRLQRTVDQRGLLTVVFTKSGETADHYIERLCDEAARDVYLGKLELRVATSDAVEQTVVLGRGAVRISAREMRYEMEQNRHAEAINKSRGGIKRNLLMENIPEDIRQKLENMRRGKR